MANPKGNLATLKPGHGRNKGSKNKATLQRADILKCFLGALNKYGADKAFEEWINDKKGRRDFLKAVIGLIPKEDTLNVRQTVLFLIVQPELSKEKKG